MHYNKLCGAQHCDYNQKMRNQPTFVNLDRITTLANKHAKPRPQYVDLAPATYHPQADNDARASSKSKSFSRKQQAGAVRRSTASQKPQSHHIGKLTFAAAVVAGAVVWTTSSSETLSPSKNNSSTGEQAFASAPAVFFDDETDALQRRHILDDTEVSAATNTDEIENLQDTDKLPLLLAMMSHPPLYEFVKPAAKENTNSITETESEQSVSERALPFVAGPSDLANSAPDSLVKPENDLTEPDMTDGSSSNSNTLLLTVSSGDTFSGILNKNGLKIDQMGPLLSHDIVNEHLSNIRVGQILELTQDDAGQFESLTTRASNDLRITISRSGEDFNVKAIDLPTERKRTVTSGKIEQSLFLAAEQADLQQSTIMELANIFQWELDFARDIREGDQFSIVYDRLYREGKYIGDGDILAADFMRGGKIYKAVRFTTGDGETGYYSPDGQAKRRTFMRHPVDVVRITSKFNPNRLHPVLHKIRAHRGVDYGSPHGSPIYATADGRVTFSGSKNAYGKTVVLKHGDKFSTLYAHMSRISDKSSVGARVKQGDVIGYVGNTGRVTGTHLHYEFRVNGVQIDPLKVELPAAEPLAARYLTRLQEMSDEMTTLMAGSFYTEDSQVATASTDDEMVPIAE